MQAQRLHDDKSMIGKSSRPIKFTFGSRNSLNVARAVSMKATIKPSVVRLEITQRLEKWDLRFVQSSNFARVN